MKAALAEWFGLAGILGRLMVALAAVGLVFVVPIGIIVLVARLAWSARF
jgi:hypothetical protein